MVVPLIRMEAPATGSPLSLETFPLRRAVWAKEAERSSRKRTVSHERIGMLSNLQQKTNSRVTPLLGGHYGNVKRMLRECYQGRLAKKHWCVGSDEQERAVNAVGITFTTYSPSAGE